MSILAPCETCNYEVFDPHLEVVSKCQQENSKDCLRLPALRGKCSHGTVPHRSPPSANNAALKGILCCCTDRGEGNTQNCHFYLKSSKSTVLKYYPVSYSCIKIFT